MLIDDICTEYKLTGNCKINIAEVIERWQKRSDLWYIVWSNSERYDYKREIYRLCKRIRKDSDLLSVKMQISKRQAQRLIRDLRLEFIQSPIFANAGILVKA